MKEKIDNASGFLLFANGFLFVFKLVVGIISNSIAIISEAINSLSDILTSIAIKISIKISHKKADEDHNYGHHAAQPLAAMILAIVAGVVGITVIKESILRIIEPQIYDYITLPSIVLGITIILKSFMYFYFRRTHKNYGSLALKAASVDAINDVLASIVALIGIITSYLGYKIFDGIAGLVISFFIIKSGYDVAKENIDYLMGRAANSEVLEDIKKAALSVDGVKDMHDLKSHYIGDTYHIEIHIEVDKNLTTEVSHRLGNEVKTEIMKIKSVSEVFVHIDPV